MNLLLKQQRKPLVQWAVRVVGAFSRGHGCGSEEGVVWPIVQVARGVAWRQVTCHRARCGARSRGAARLGAAWPTAACREGLSLACRCCQGLAAQRGAAWRQCRETSADAGAGDVTSTPAHATGALLVCELLHEELE